MANTMRPSTKVASRTLPHGEIQPADG
jgi:hypothetical protein